MKEGVINPIRKFMNGPQKRIFDNARKFAQTQEPNFAYIEERGSGKPKVREHDPDEPSTAALLQILTDPECFKGSRMQQVKAQVEALQKKIATQIEDEISKARKTIGALKERLFGMAEFSVLSGEQQEQITRPFDEVVGDIERQQLIAVIRDTLRRFEENGYQRQLSQMTAWAQPAPAPEPEPEIGGVTSPDEKPSTPPAKPEPRIEYVPTRCIRVPFEKAWLADENDVDRYLESMRTALLEEIRQGKRIQI